MKLIQIFILHIKIFLKLKKKAILTLKLKLIDKICTYIFVRKTYIQLFSIRLKVQIVTGKN